MPTTLEVEDCSVKVVHCFAWKLPGLARSSSESSSVNMKMSMEHWWNDTDWGRPKYWDKNLFQCHFVHH
jgi:hypothetical protein